MYLTFFSLGDAEATLLRSALIEKTTNDSLLSMHRLTQTAVIQRLSQDDRKSYAQQVVRLLSWGFPDTWSQDVGHQFGAWKKCEQCLPHVVHLRQTVEKLKIRPPNLQEYAELLLKCSWYEPRRSHFSIDANEKTRAGICTNERHTT
jgi:hypothetical protein